MTIQTIQQFATSAGSVVTAGLAVVGAVGAFCTVLAHLPASIMPAKSAAFFARIGLASSRFAVTKKVSA